MALGHVQRASPGGRPPVDLPRHVARLKRPSVGEFDPVATRPCDMRAEKRPHAQRRDEFAQTLLARECAQSHTLAEPSTPRSDAHADHARGRPADRRCARPSAPGARKPRPRPWPGSPAGARLAPPARGPGAGCAPVRVRSRRRARPRSSVGPSQRPARLRATGCARGRCAPSTAARVPASGRAPTNTRKGVPSTASSACPVASAATSPPPPSASRPRSRGESDAVHSRSSTSSIASRSRRRDAGTVPVLRERAARADDLPQVVAEDPPRRGLGHALERLPLAASRCEAISTRIGRRYACTWSGAHSGHDDAAARA